MRSVVFAVAATGYAMSGLVASHGPDKRFAERPDDLASGGLLLRVDLKFLQHAFQNLNVFPCL